MTLNLDHLVRRWFGKVAAVAAAVLVLNVCAYVFGVARLGDLASAERASTESEGEVLAGREAKAKETAAQVAAFHEGQRALDVLAREHWKTRGERLAEAQRKLEELVRAAGLATEGFSYNYAALPSASHRKAWSRQYIQVTIAFRAAGSYPQLKAFLESLQTSPQFFVVEAPTVSASNQGAVLLNMNLQVSTYFLDGEPPAVVPAKDAPKEARP